MSWMCKLKMTSPGNPRFHVSKGKPLVIHASIAPLYNLSVGGIHAVRSLRSRSGRGLIKLVLAGYPEIGVLPMSHFQHDHPYLC